MVNYNNQMADIQQQIREGHKAQSAEGYCERLYKTISQFDHELDEHHEIAVRLVSFGQSVTFQIESIGYINPGLIIFNGHTDNGDRVQLTQHMTQISFLLLAVKRSNPEEPKRPIGFSSME